MRSRNRIASGGMNDDGADDLVRSRRDEQIGDEGLVDPDSTVLRNEKTITLTPIAIATAAASAAIGDGVAHERTRQISSREFGSDMRDDVTRDRRTTRPARR